MYLMLSTHPDLAYAVEKLARFSSNPSPNHQRALKRVLLYLRSHPTRFLEWLPDGTSTDIDGNCNLDWAGNRSDSKSTTGYFFFLDGTAFSWSSKKEAMVATSTMEAEYIALFMACQQATWIRGFMAQLGLPINKPIENYCDSTTALSVAAAEETHQRAKHISVKYHSIHKHIQNHEVATKWVCSDSNQSDILMNSLPVNVFQNHVARIGLESEPTSDGDEEAKVDEILTPPYALSHWGQRGCYPGGKLRVYPLGLLRAN